MSRVYFRVALNLALIGFASFAPQAYAGTITLTYDFSANSFTPSPAPGTQPVAAPVDPVRGSFTVTFDPTEAVMDQSTGIELNNLNIPFDYPVAFSYFSSFQGLYITGSLGGATSIEFGTNAFVLEINNAANTVNNPAYFALMIYTESALPNDSWVATFSGNVDVVPEPGTFVLLGGLPLIGFMYRRRLVGSR